MRLLKEYMELSLSERQAHIDLESDCIIRGTSSTHCRGILAHFLDTDMNTAKVDCCHACNNESCSNPKHLYWGTRSENMKDFVAANPDYVFPNSFEYRNPNMGKEPWRNIGAIKTHPKMLTVWASAGMIYNEYFKKNWDFSKYGQGGGLF